MALLLLLALLCTMSLVSADTSIVADEVGLQAAISRGENITISTTINLQEEIFVNSSITLTSACEGGCTLTVVGSHRHFTVSGYDTTFLLQNVTLVGGSAPGGGALLVKGGAVVIITSVVFTSNSVSAKPLGGGGAIMLMNGSEVYVVLSTFTSNSAPFGGAIEASGNSKLSVKDSNFMANKATVAGGAINVIDSSSLVITGCNIVGSSAPIGGAINVASSSAATCASNTTGNSVDLSGYGPDVLAGQAANVTFCQNVTSQVVSARGGLVSSNCDECEPTPGRGMHGPGKGHHPPGIGHHPRTRGHRGKKKPTQVLASAAPPPT